MSSTPTVVKASGTTENSVEKNTTVEMELRDIRGLMDQNIQKRSLIRDALPLAAALSILIILWYRLLKPRRESAALLPAPKPAIPPDVLALKELEALLKSDLLARREFKEWYMRLSRICRTYTGAAFDFNCVDCDSFEILEALGSRKVPKRCIDAIDALLSECDLVKFAKFSPDEFEALEAHKNCAGIITKPGEGGPQ